MKNKKTLRLIVSIICFIAALFFAVIYAIWESKNVRIIAALCFAFCALICLKTFLEYLKEIRFGKKIFAPLRKLFAKLYKNISVRLGSLMGKDEDKIYVSGKKDEFQMKFELFKAAKTSSERKSKPKLPKYSSLTTEKEKIRYIYTVFLKKKIDRGYKLDPARTPEEIGEDFAQNEKARELFAAYPVARYADENEPLDVTSKQLEDII